MSAIEKINFPVTVIRRMVADANGAHVLSVAAHLLSTDEDAAIAEWVADTLNAAWEAQQPQPIVGQRYLEKNGGKWARVVEIDGDITTFRTMDGAVRTHVATAWFLENYPTHLV